VHTRGSGCGCGGRRLGAGVARSLGWLGGAGGKVLLALAALGRGHPGGLDVRGAVEAPAFAAGAAAHVGAVLLGLVAAVLAADGARAGAGGGAPPAPRGARGGVIGEADDVGRVEVVLLRRVVRPQLEAAAPGRGGGRRVEVSRGGRGGGGRGVGAGGRADVGVVVVVVAAAAAAVVPSSTSSSSA
jgi:hypothetical protein